MLTSELRMRLTRTGVTNLTLPPGKPYQIVWDELLPGFGVRINPTGKVWVVQYRAEGKSRRQTLGRTDTVALDVAREAARTLLARVQLGGDPHAEKIEQDKRRSISFRVATEQYLKSAQGRLKPRSFEEVRRHLTSHASPLHGSPIIDINRGAISNLLQEIAQTKGPIASNRVRASLSALFSYGLSMGFVDQNPVSATLKFGDEVQRDRVLDQSEIAAIWRGCKENDYGRIVRILLLTAQRRDEVGGMRWSELNFREGLWTIPSQRTKNGRTHEVPLSEMAISLLQSIPQILHRDLVFGSGTRGYSGWSKSKADLDQRLVQSSGALISWRLHDLRRTAATGMANLGIQPHVIEAILNHISGYRSGVAGIYNRASYREEKRAALDRWATHLATLIGSHFNAI